MINLTQEQTQILWGTILGDGFLQKTGKKNARLRLEHSLKQKPYLLWKVQKLAKLFQGRPKTLKRIHPQTGRTYFYIRHQSQSTPLLGKLRKQVYPQGKKTIPENLEEILTPLVLAVWYMDDGYYYQRDRCAYLYLGNIKEKEALRVSQSLERVFGLKSRVLKKKKGWALYFSPGQTLKLRKLIADHLLPEFKYKLPS